MDTIKELIEKFNKCEVISTKDIKRMAEFYETICPLADELGSEFGLMKIELHRRKEEIQRCLG